MDIKLIKEIRTQTGDIRLLEIIELFIQKI